MPKTRTAIDITVGSYDWMRVQLACKKERKIYHETWARLEPDQTVVVKLWETDIMRFYTSGNVELNAGGYRTVTTKARINNYLPHNCGIYVEKGVWYLAAGNGIFLFRNGITIDKDGNVVTDKDGWLPTKLPLDKPVEAVVY